MRQSFLHQLYRPGHSPDVVAIVLGCDEYHLAIPDTWTLIDIAAAYQWAALVPGCLLDEDRERMTEYLADTGHKLTAQRLHIAMQSLGTYIYGWPFYVAARALRLIRFYEAGFRAWSLLNLSRNPEEFSAADWTSASIAWQLSMQSKEEDRLSAWAELTIPGRLPIDAPGVTPDWMRRS